MTIRAENEMTLVRVDDGEEGAQGTTFYPNVSQEGVLSWTNDGEKPNPEPVVIKGPQGISLNSVTRYYKLSATKPTDYPPSSGWLTSEPAYTPGDARNLYICDLFAWSNSTVTASEISLSSSFEAAKQAYNAAQGALTAANSKNTIFHQDTKPTGGTYKVGDTWFDTNDGYKMYTYDGTDWVAEQLGANAIEDLAITNAKIANGTIQDAKISTVDAGKITTGTLDANRIGANSLTIGKIATADQEQILNSKVQIGGRNLLLKTNMGVSFWRFNLGTKYLQPTIEEITWLGVNAMKATSNGLSTVTSPTTWAVLEYRDADVKNKIIAGQEYILSFDSNVSLKGSLKLNDSNSQNPMMTNISTTIEEKIDENNQTYYHHVYRSKANETLVISTQVLYDVLNLTTFIETEGNILKIANLKLEIGNKATDWTPAPEDIDADIQAVDIKATDAAKTATNYIHADSTNGLVVNNNQAVGTGYDIQLKANGSNTGMNIRQDENILASFLKNVISLGKNDINSKIAMCGDKGGVQASFGYYVDEVSSDNAKMGTTLDFDFNEEVFKAKVGNKAAMYQFMYTSDEGWVLFDYEAETTPSVILSQYGITMRTTALNDYASVYINYVQDGSVKFYNADTDYPIRRLELEMAESATGSTSDYANITIERQKGTYASGDGKEHSIITMMTLHEYANVATLQLFDNEISMDCDNLYINAQTNMDLFGNINGIGDVCFDGLIRTGWDKEPLIKYKQLTATYTVSAGSNKSVTFSAAALHPAGYENYHVIGIAYIRTTHETVCKVSAWNCTYKGDCTVTLSNHGNSSAVSSSTMTVNFIYAHDNLF